MDGLVVKRNESLEHMTGFSLQERRFFAFCLQFFDSRPGAEIPTEIEINIEDFKKAYPEYKKYKPNQLFDVIHTARHSVNDKPYRWQEPGEKLKEADWFTGHGVGPDDITVSLNNHPKVLELFTNIKAKFIKYHMSDVSRLSSPLSWNLYEYVKEKFMNGTVPYWTVTVDDLRARFNATDKYKIFADFEKRCIRIPAQQINEHTDLVISYKKHKKGVRVVALSFDVKTKAPDPETVDIENLSVTFTRDQMRHGISENVATRNTQQAEKLGKLSESIAKVPLAHKSWQKHGKGPFSGYLAKVLTNDLFQQDLFKSNGKADTTASGYTDFSSYSVDDLEIFLRTTPAYKEDILREKKRRGLI